MPIPAKGWLPNPKPLTKVKEADFVARLHAIASDEDALLKTSAEYIERYKILLYAIKVSRGFPACPRPFISLFSYEGCDKNLLCDSPIYDSSDE